MARAHRSLAVAASSYPNSAENRLTELYGTVLAQHDGFARSVLNHTELPIPAEHKVFTQEGFGPDGQVDLILRGRDSSGALVSILYAEHKESGGVWQDGQPRKYLRALTAETRGTARGRLLVVVGGRSDLDGRVRKRARIRAAAEDAAAAAELRAAGPSDRMIFTTWHELAGWADDAGRAEPDPVGGAGWLDRADSPETPARVRVLAELIWYLEEMGYTVTKPLTSEQLSRFSEAEDLFAALAQIMKGATELLQDTMIGVHSIALPARAKNDDLSARFVAPPRSWVARWNGQIYLELESSDTTAPGDGGAMFTFTVEVSKTNARILDSRPAFHKGVRDASLKFELDDAAGYCWAEMPAQRIVAGKTISEQSEILADWAREALTKLLTLTPGRYPSR